MDGEKFADWKGGSLFFYGIYSHGANPTQMVGDTQGTSNIETAVTTWKLYEAWAQQLLWEDKVSFLIGLHDLNSEFYVTDSSGMFLNSSFGVGKEFAQTGKNGPSIFPTTAPAIRLRGEPSKSFYIQWAVFNGQAGDPTNLNSTNFRLKERDGLLLITEMAYLRGRGDMEGKELPAKYAIGLWTYTATFDHQNKSLGVYDTTVPVDTTTTPPTVTTIGTPEQVTSTGSYFLLDQGLTENTSFFTRFGIASKKANRVASDLSAGVNMKGFFGFRPKDRLGIGATRATNGHEYLEVQKAANVETKDAETTFELAYRIELLPGIAMTPDFQYVMYPNSDPKIGNARVVTLRTEINL